MNKWNIRRRRRRERMDGWMDAFISQHYFYLIAKFPSLETFVQIHKKHPNGGFYPKNAQRVFHNITQLLGCVP